MSDQPVTADLPDEPELPMPDNFDLGAWISGVRSNVRAVNVYARADLMAEADVLEAKLQIARAAAEEDEEASLGEPTETERLTEQLNEVYKQFVDSGITFKIQGRSENWLKDVEKRFKNHSDTNGLSKDEKTVYVQLHQLAEAIVQPEGVTFDHLTALREASEPQVRKLLVAFSLANNQAPQVSAPFSHPSSGARSTRRR